MSAVATLRVGLLTAVADLALYNRLVAAREDAERVRDYEAAHRLGESHGVRAARMGDAAFDMRCAYLYDPTVRAFRTLVLR